MVAAYCSPEDACPGTGLGVTDSGLGLQILGAVAAAYSAQLHSTFRYDCTQQAGQGMYFTDRVTRTVMTAAQRGALAGGELYAGREVYESDTDKVYVYSTVLAAWVMVADYSAWDTYTAVLVGNGAPVTATSNRLDFTRHGREIQVTFDMSATASATAGEIKITPTGLPAPVANGTRALGQFWYDPNAGNHRVGIVEWDGTDLRFVVDNNNGYLGSSPALTLTNGDRISGQFTYQSTS